MRLLLGGNCQNFMKKDRSSIIKTASIIADDIGDLVDSNGNIRNYINEKSVNPFNHSELWGK